MSELKFFGFAMQFNISNQVFKSTRRIDPPTYHLISLYLLVAHETIFTKNHSTQIKKDLTNSSDKQMKNFDIFFSNTTNNVYTHSN